MVVAVVNVYVKPECIDEFIKATLNNHNGTIKEEGNLRFDVLQAKDDPCHFTLYEVFKSPEASAKHKETQHYLTWRDTVAPLMAKPREAVVNNVVAPLDEKMFSTL
ncbi:MAG: antibiotic biosynthesis monooxygenase [Ruminococcaceae bacterium]|nr:antibiotic biosynthesis monooxygenase [Oscillospiraceae bacterium]